MKKGLLIPSALLMTAALASPARAWQANAQDHAAHHPDTPAANAKTAPPASSATLDELVKKMNAAQGQAKVDAMAELLTALVQTHQTMHAGMQNMGGMHRK